MPQTSICRGRACSRDGFGIPMRSCGDFCSGIREFGSIFAGMAQSSQRSRRKNFGDSCGGASSEGGGLHTKHKIDIIHDEGPSHVGGPSKSFVTPTRFHPVGVTLFSNPDKIKAEEKEARSKWNLTTNR